ncbi:MAG: hypothetical protein H0W88_09150 [Parachlamydiaceae bacterium]|nr:hypothetical protein [Parachlamydiaceae bacterium]
MKIEFYLQPHWSSNSGRLLHAFSKSSLFANGKSIPKVTFKVAAFIIAQVFLKLFLAVPLITLAATADIINWSICTLQQKKWKSKLYSNGFSNHLIDLISLQALPIISIGYALVNQLPKGNRFYRPYEGIASVLGTQFLKWEQDFLFPLRYPYWKTNTIYIIERIASAGFKSRNELLYAVKGNSRTIEPLTLIKAGADTRGILADTALDGTPEQIKTLIKAGVNPDQISYYGGVSPMRQACIWWNFPNAEALLEGGADPEQTIEVDGHGPLPLIAATGLQIPPSNINNEEALQWIEKRNTFFSNVFEKLIKMNLGWDSPFTQVDKKNCKGGSRMAYTILTAPIGILPNLAKKFQMFNTESLENLWDLLHDDFFLDQLPFMNDLIPGIPHGRTFEIFLQECMKGILKRKNQSDSILDPYFVTIEYLAKQKRGEFFHRWCDPSYRLQLTNFILQEGKRYSNDFTDKLQNVFNQVYRPMGIRGIDRIISNYACFAPEAL